jgi:hypothetical protein
MSTVASSYRVVCLRSWREHFSVDVGFGLQDVINNFLSGLIVLFERPIKVGDVIQVGAAIGSVKKIGIRASAQRQLYFLIRRQSLFPVFWVKSARCFWCFLGLVFYFLAA